MAGIRQEVLLLLCFLSIVMGQLSSTTLPGSSIEKGAFDDDDDDNDLNIVEEQMDMGNVIGEGVEEVGCQMPDEYLTDGAGQLWASVWVILFQIYLPAAAFASIFSYYTF